MVSVGHPLTSGMFPRWASSIADSVYGPVAGITVGTAEYRFRWIPAGSFWMGAGDQEPEEWELTSERPRHQVTLTEGFWMGEAPCTQALWTEVMGDNPSEFPDPERPVERVSWEDVQDFLARLEVRIPGLGAVLPTEAQWEYACRAGSETATYAGELAPRGKRNDPVVDPIAWYGGNSGHRFDLDDGYDASGWSETQYPFSTAGTRKVKTRQPNPWGLYDMLGNVWEWCQDGYGEYSAEPKEDPRGPLEGGRRDARRVLRGGSWLSDARNVRAASRVACPPSLRLDDIGFRFARGQR